MHTADESSETEMNDGWKDDDLFFEDDEKVIQTDEPCNQVTLPKAVPSCDRFFSMTREAMNDTDSKIFWAEAIRRINDARADPVLRFPDCEEPSFIPVRQRYRTRAERLGLNVTF